MRGPWLLPSSVALRRAGGWLRIAEHDPVNREPVQKSPTGCPSPMLPRICHVSKLMLSRAKRTEPSARQTFTPPGCRLRAGTIPTQLSHDKPAPPTPAPPAPFRHFQLGGDAVLNSALL